MTNSQKIARVQGLVGHDANATYEIVSVLLEQAAETLLAVIDPFFEDGDPADLPEKYGSIQCELAARYYARMGANGEVTHNENGINRSWGSPDDADLLRKVTPRAKVY